MSAAPDERGVRARDRSLGGLGTAPSVSALVACVACVAGCGAKTGAEIPPRVCSPPEAPLGACRALSALPARTISEGLEGVTALDVAPYETGVLVLRRSTVGGTEGWRVSTVDEDGNLVDHGARGLVGPTEDPLRRAEGSITAGCAPVALLEERVDALGMQARCTLVPIEPLPIRFTLHALEGITTGCHDLHDDALGPSFVEIGPPTRIVHVARDGTIGETSTLHPEGPWLTIRPRRLRLSGGGWAMPFFADGGGVVVVLLDEASRPVGTARWQERSSPIGVASSGARAVWEAANGPDEDPIRLETVALQPDGRPAGPAHVIPTEGWYFLSYGLDVAPAGEDTLLVFRGGRIGEPARVHAGLLDRDGALVGDWIPLVAAERARLSPTRHGALVIAALRGREPAEIDAIPLRCDPGP